ncbi:hypothetical protein SD78_1034 [Bacillus badius]|nr:hypothetical protein SD78_1034 [Bacillus badius]
MLREDQGSFVLMVWLICWILSFIDEQVISSSNLLEREAPLFH